MTGAMTSSPGSLALALAAGVALGALYFAGLWWTVRRGAASATPARLFLGSFLLRTAVALGGLSLVGGGRWERLLVGLLGFVLGRVLVIRWSGAPLVPNAATPEVEEARRAPQP